MTDPQKELTSTDSRVRCTLSKCSALVVLDRPDKLNALDESMVSALGNLCGQLEREDSVRCVILTGAGNKSFCAGGDIDAWSEQSAEDFGRFWLREGHLVFERIARLRQPVIALLNGHTLGGGLELAACADYRIAESHIKLGQPETGLGIIPGWSGTQRMVRRFGAGVTRRMALFGETFSAQEALSLGLVDRVCETHSGLDEAQELIKLLVTKSPRATELTKMLINSAEGEENSRVIETLAGVVAAESSELSKGLKAYREKRKPEY